MIKESFIFLDRISHTSERMIWQHAGDWKTFIDAKRLPHISPKRKLLYDHALDHAHDALIAEDAHYFAERMPEGEAWRLYDTFKDDALFLDIETSLNYGDITVIGLSDGEDFKPMVRGCNLNRELFFDSLKDKKLIITFNGASFDLPVIERYFGTRLPKIPHIDLRHVCAKVGLKGGLKAIEHRLGIGRPEEAQGVTGMDAVWLWQKFQLTKDPAVLDKLIAYNQADVLNMKTLADQVIPWAWRAVRSQKEF